MSILGKFLAFIINALLGARIWWLSFDYFEGMGAAALGPGMILMLGMPVFIIAYGVALSFFQEYIWQSYQNKRLEKFLVFIPALLFLGYKGLQELPTQYARVEVFWTSFVILAVITVGSFSLVALRWVFHRYGTSNTKQKNRLPSSI
jgi:hypothetical protein